MHLIYICAGELSIAVGRIARGGPASAFLRDDREVADLACDGQQLAVDHRPCSRFDDPGKLPILSTFQGNDAAVPLVSLYGVGREHTESDGRSGLQRVCSLGQDYSVRVGIDGIDRVQQEAKSRVPGDSTDLEGSPFVTPFGGHWSGHFTRVCAGPASLDPPGPAQMFGWSATCRRIADNRQENPNGSPHPGL